MPRAFPNEVALSLSGADPLSAGHGDLGAPGQEALPLSWPQAASISDPRLFLMMAV